MEAVLLTAEQQAVAMPECAGMSLEGGRVVA
jgi:hypothetical protein